MKNSCFSSRLLEYSEINIFKSLERYGCHDGNYLFSSSFWSSKQNIPFAGEDGEAIGDGITKENILNGPIFDEGTPLLYASVVSFIIFMYIKDIIFKYAKSALHL